MVATALLAQLGEHWSQGPAVGRRFKPWPDQQPRPLKSGKIMLKNLIFNQILLLSNVYGPA